MAMHAAFSVHRGAGRIIVAVLLLLCALAMLASCGGGGGARSGTTPAPPNPTVARVVITPATASVEVGKTVTLSAQALDASGAALARTFTWTSSDTSKATVDGNGVVSGVAAGAASVTATADAVTSTPA